MRRAFALVLLLASGGLLIGHPAAAQESGCTIGQEGVTCVIEAPGTTPTTTPGPDPEEPDDGIDIRVTFAIGPCPAGQTYYLIEEIERATGTVLDYYFECRDDLVPPPPPPPPPPPTPGQVVDDIAELLELETGLSPPPDGIGGVSQLDTWFWCDNSGPVTASATLNGWTVTATATITLLTWTVSGPDGTVDATGTDCGTEPDPFGDGEGAAAIWTPNEPGAYSIVLTAEWGGSFTRTYGAISQTVDLGTISLSEPAVPYSVVEIQTVGTENR